MGTRGRVAKASRAGRAHAIGQKYCIGEKRQRHQERHAPAIIAAASWSVDRNQAAAMNIMAAKRMPTALENGLRGRSGSLSNHTLPWPKAMPRRRIGNGTSHLFAGHLTLGVDWGRRAVEHLDVPACGRPMHLQRLSHMSTLGLWLGGPRCRPRI